MGVIKRKKYDIPDDVVRYVDHSMNIAKRIDAHLVEMKWSQKDLADKLGKNEATISTWMRGTHNFSLRTISKIESVMNRNLI